MQSDPRAIALEQELGKWIQQGWAVTFKGTYNAQVEKQAWTQMQKTGTLILTLFFIIPGILNAMMIGKGKRQGWYIEVDAAGKIVRKRAKLK
jgi:hypothetical protein